MSVIALSFASDDQSLSVRRFRVEERLSAPFQVSVTAQSPDDGLDLDSLVGQPAELRVDSGVANALAPARLWSGICNQMEQVRVEPSGLSTYELTIVPTLWLLEQRSNHRLFQHISIPDILAVLLGEWQIEHTFRIDRPAYPPLELRTQYGESDYHFFSRLLEEAGITFTFAEDPVKGSVLVLLDNPQAAEARGGAPLPFVDSPGQSQAGQLEYVTDVRLGRGMKTGRVTLRDFDFRRPRLPLSGAVAATSPLDQRHEHYRYAPGDFLVEGGKGGDTPVADDKAVARFEQTTGQARAGRELDARRVGRRSVRLATNALDLRPGTLYRIAGHPHPELAADRTLLVTSFTIEGAVGEEWHLHGQAVFAADPYRPPHVTPKPQIIGAQSALVVGPPGEEIYTDELGRVRVQFHWDREGQLDDHSSMWMRVSQGWAGPGYGMLAIPRVGHEVLVGYLEGDPDHPLVVGRVFNGVATVPYKLPENKTVTTWKSDTSPGSEGFNEIRFDDAMGREHVYMQAQKDLAQLVKNDERGVVGHDRSRLVRNDEAVTIGGSRTAVVKNSETATTGLHSTITVGLDRRATVGVNDTSLVGSMYSVTIARGLPGALAQGIGAVMSGPLGPLVDGPLTSVLGAIPHTPLGAAPLAALAHGPISVLTSLAPAPLAGLIGMAQQLLDDDPGVSPTNLTMIDKRISWTTGGASIELDGSTIRITAAEDIVIAAKKKITIISEEDTVTLQGGPILSLNPDLQPPGCNCMKGAAKQGSAFVDMSEVA